MENRVFTGRLSSWVLSLFAGGLLVILCFVGGELESPGKYSMQVPLGVFGISDLILPAGWFVLIFSMSWILFLILLLVYPRRLSKGKSIVFLMALALLCRIALIPHSASDDVNRYLWEGRLIIKGFSPYHLAPDDPSLEILSKSDPFHVGINHPSNSAGYPPFVIYLFALIGHISYSLLSIKIAMILFDMGCIALLLLLLEQRRLDYRWSIIYAFNPVILYSFAGQGHFDVIQIFFLLGALCLYDRRSWPWMFLFAGLAVQSKYVAAAAIPFLLRKDNIKYAWIGGVAIVLPYLPLVDAQWSRFFSGIIQFGEEYAFNGSVHGLLRGVFGGIGPATTVCKILLGVSLSAGFWYFHPKRGCRFKEDPIPGCFFIFGALLIFAPTVHFWYLTWIIPFMVFHPRVSWILLCLTISGYFVTNGISYHTGEWRLPVAVQLMEWIPFYLLFFFNIYYFLYRLREPAASEAPKSLSVIVPVKNESGLIKTCLESIFRDRAVNEVIAVDGGSTDHTIDLAKEMGARVLVVDASPGAGGGRGGQIKAGLKKAKGDVIAVVHADTLVAPSTFSNMMEILEKQPSVIGGAVGSTFDGPGWGLRLLDIANDFRALFLGISFGDQVQFFRRQPVVEKDLYPGIPLMEDVEIGLRLNRLGRQVFLFGDAKVSPRRWQTTGYSNAIRVIRRMTVYLFKRLRGTPDTVRLYRDYYGETHQKGHKTIGGPGI